MKWAPYPKYKPSGIEWLGRVPEHWEEKPLGRLVRFASGATPNKANPEFWDGDIPWVSPKEMKRPRICDAADHVSQEAMAHSPLSLLPVQSILIVVRGMILAHSFPVAITDVPVTINQDIKALTAGKMINPEFLLWLLKGAGSVLVSLTDESTHGTRKLESETVAKLGLPVPPIAEQVAIAHFLDRETAKIDTLMAKKRMLIERLEEKRLALISRTTTRGLPPNAARALDLAPHPKLKASGIASLGVVPEHWEVKQFRYLVRRLDQGWSPVATNQPAGEGDWGVLKLSAVRGGRFFPGKNKALQDEPEEASVATPQANDLLISRANTPDRVGDVALVLGEEPRLLIPDLLYRAQISASVAEPAFVCYFLLSGGARAQIEADARGSSGSMVKLSQSHIRAWFIPFPPRAEQLAIVSYLNQETARIDTMTAKVEAALERIREYRAALITAAVTGKVDVQAEVP